MAYFDSYHGIVGKPVRRETPNFVKNFYEFIMPQAKPYKSGVDITSMTDTKAELHSLVNEYMHDWCGVADDAILHEQINTPAKRDSIYYEFLEWVSEYPEDGDGTGPVKHFE